MMASATARTPGRPFNVLLDGNIAAPNVLIFTEHLNATHIISFDIPLRNMHARGDINFAVVDSRNVALSDDPFSEQRTPCWEIWCDRFKPDLVVMTRYALPFPREIIAFLKASGIPVIYHIDDNLLDLPPSLGADVLQRQANDGVIDARTHLLSCCDTIYASTAHLAEILRSKFPGKPVFHGIYASYPQLQAQAVTHGERTVIGYMGSRGHQADLALAVPALLKLLDERPALHFEVYGTIHMPEILRRFGDRVQSIPVTKSYRDFLVKLSSLDWHVGLAPLVNEPFNLCKAPTKYIEYTACGISVVASDIPVYSDAMPRDGGILTQDDWYGAITTMLDDGERRGSSLRTARAHCAEVYSIRNLEQQLADLFGLALGRS